MSDLRWLCEVVHTWGQNTRGTLPVRGLTIGGTKSDAHEVQRCDFCKRGHVTGCNERISFRQCTDKGYVSCRVEIPIGVCECWWQSIGIKTQRRSSTRSFGENTTSFVSTILVRVLINRDLGNCWLMSGSPRKRPNSSRHSLDDLVETVKR